MYLTTLFLKQHALIFLNPGHSHSCGSNWNKSIYTVLFGAKTTVKLNLRNGFVLKCTSPAQKTNGSSQDFIGTCLPNSCSITIFELLVRS